MLGVLGGVGREKQVRDFAGVATSCYLGGSFPELFNFELGQVVTPISVCWWISTLITLGWGEDSWHGAAMEERRNATNEIQYCAISLPFI